MINSQIQRLPPSSPHLSESESHSLLLDSSNFEREWNDVQFGGQQYSVNVSVNYFDEKYEDSRKNSVSKETTDHEYSSSSSNGYVLLIETELQSTGQRWTGEFTSLYLEEISQKVGSFKRFTTFLKMLYSALSRESDNVVLEFLTYEELEEIKARKMQSLNSGSPVVRKVAAFDSTGRQKRSSQQKRYFILTYRGEFDMVHYPLPLPFEEQPSYAALQRMNTRLRKKLAQRVDGITLSERERELRQLVTTLRQENTELRHRLRQTESRAVKQTSNSWTSPNPNLGRNLAASGVEVELQATNMKLRRQLEYVRQELHSSNILLERERADAAKRRLKSSPSPSGRERSTGRSNSTEVGGNNQAVLELKRRLVDLERQLRLERYNRSRVDEVDKFHRKAVKSKIFHSAPSSQSSGLTRRSFSADSSTSRLHTYQKPPRYATPTLMESRESRSNHTVRTPSPANANSTVVPASSYGWSSSLGGRFDPTAYRQQQLQRRQLASTSRERAWGAGVGNRNARTESGYASANSQSSGGSSSRRSQGSAQQSVRTETSNASGRGKSSQRRKKRSTRKMHSPAATPADEPAVATARELQRSSLQLLKKTILTENNRHRLRSSAEKREDITSKDFDGKAGIQKDAFKQIPNDSDDDDQRSQRGFSSSTKFQNKVTDRFQQGKVLDVDTISHDPRSSAIHTISRRDPDRQVDISGDLRFLSSSSKPVIREEGASELKESVNSMKQFFNSTGADGIDVMKSSDSWLGAQSLSSEQSRNSSDQTKTGQNDISEIDRRIQALQAYLDNARSGILSTGESQTIDRSKNN